MPGALATSAEVLVEEAVGGVPHFGREVVLTVRVLHAQVLGDTVKPIDRGGGIHNAVHTLPAEVGVALGCVDKTGRGASAPISSGKSKGMSSNRPR